MDAGPAITTSNLQRLRRCAPLDVDSLLELVRQAHRRKVEKLHGQLAEALGDAWVEPPQIHRRDRRAHTIGSPSGFSQLDSAASSAAASPATSEGMRPQCAQEVEEGAGGSPLPWLNHAARSAVDPLPAGFAPLVEGFGRRRPHRSAPVPRAVGAAIDSMSSTIEASPASDVTGAERGETPPWVCEHPAKRMLKTEVWLASPRPSGCARCQQAKVAELLPAKGDGRLAQDRLAHLDPSLDAYGAKGAHPEVVDARQVEEVARDLGLEACAVNCACPPATEANGAEMPKQGPDVAAYGVDFRSPFSGRTPKHFDPVHLEVRHLEPATPTSLATSRFQVSVAERYAVRSFHSNSSTSSFKLGANEARFHKLVTNPWFDIFFAACITVNSIVFAAEIQYRGLDLGYSLGHQSTQRSGAAAWPWAEDLFTCTGTTFGILFFAEIVLKLLGLRCVFFWDPWNYIDTAIVIVWLVDTLATVLSFNTQVLRLLRLARIVRVVKLFKFMRRQGFDSLYIMTSAVSGSMSILFWTVVALLVGHMFMALILSQVLFAVYFSGSIGEEPSAGQLEVYTYYGTFSRALLTMFEISLANWPPACRLLVENVSEWFILYALIHKLTIGFAVIGVVNGVLIQETFKVVAENDTIMVNRTERDYNTHVQKMTRLFRAADENDNGWLDLESFKLVCEDRWVKSWLMSMGLDTSDAESLYNLLDDGDGQLTVDELVVGVGKLKGCARSIDMMTALSKMERLEKGAAPPPKVCLHSPSEVGLESDPASRANSPTKTYELPPSQPESAMASPAKLYEAPRV